MSQEIGPRAVIAAVFEHFPVDTTFFSGEINLKVGVRTNPTNTLQNMRCIAFLDTRPNPREGGKVERSWQFFHDPMRPDHISHLEAAVKHRKTYGSGIIPAAPGECDGCQYAHGTVICPQLEKFATLRQEMIVSEGLQGKE